MSACNNNTDMKSTKIYMCVFIVVRIYQLTTIHCVYDGRSGALMLLYHHLVTGARCAHCQHSVTGAYITYQHSVTGARITYQYSVTDERIIYQHSVTGAHIIYQHSVTGAHIIYQHSTTGAHIIYQQSVTGAHFISLDIYI